MRVLMIGGTGKFSGRVTEAAVAWDHEVMLYNRGQHPQPEGLDLPLIQGERGALRQYREAIADFDPEAVVDSVTYTPEEAQALVDLFPDVRRLVMISTVDTYGQDIGGSPVTEAREPRPVSDYGKNKLAAEKALLEGLGDTVTIFRPSHILGRGFTTTSLWSRSPYFVDRVRKGKVVPAIDGGRNLMTPVYAADIAEWIMRALSNPVADGQIFNAVGPEIIPQKRYYEAVAATLDAELKLVTVPSPVFRRCFDSPPQFNWHRPYSCAKVVDLLGYAPRFTPEMMIEETVNYMLAYDLVKDCAEAPFDDRLVELLLKQEAALGHLFATKAAD
jgi:nucleoside-diphosphate-sugar epimerase